MLKSFPPFLLIMPKGQSDLRIIIRPGSGDPSDLEGIVRADLTRELRELGVRFDIKKPLRSDPSNILLILQIISAGLGIADKILDIGKKLSQKYDGRVRIEKG